MHGRVVIQTGDLELIVADQINQAMLAQQIFTAYDLTRSMRTAYPHLHIGHDEVRVLVHAQMEALLATGIYERETGTYQGATAVRYLPAH